MKTKFHEDVESNIIVKILANNVKKQASSRH